MSPLEVLQLVGYSIGAVLPLWMGIQLISRRRSLSPIERVLFALALSMCGWHSSNLIITLHSLLGFGFNQWTTLLRVADTIAVISITFAYSFLLHVHIYLWANAADRPLKQSEKIRIYLSYVPTLFLTVAIYKIWTGQYAPMLSRVNLLVLPMAAWIAYVLGLIAITELMIARKSRNRSEQRIMRTLAASFVAIGIVILAALALGLGEGTQLGLYLKTIANLGSLLPSALLAYYIYRYRYLELIIEESLVVATFAAVVLTIYIYGIQTIGSWATRRYGIRPGVVEALLILALALGAAPLRSWLGKRFHKLFEREAALYRQIVSRISSHAGKYKQLPELLDFVERETTVALGLRRVHIVISDGISLEAGSEHDTSGNSGGTEAWVEQVLNLSRSTGGLAVEESALLDANGYKIAYPLQREDRVSGLLLVDASAGTLSEDTRSILEILAGQVAIAIEDCRLVEENVRLERRLAERERLATLGQMAATVAHEIKNPLSAIKSIAQVMGEDESVSREYARDLSLIVGETDRLGQSVTQLLSFARQETPAELPMRAEQLIRSVVRLFEVSAEKDGIKLSVEIGQDEELGGGGVSAVRVALSNLLLNSLQATPAGGEIKISQKTDKGVVIISLEDNGPGVPEELRKRIWEPFFTTKQ
ncbi:MAG TPA: histidine kinase dimerization/phospho-acceptor domain-containing protein, partial [Pyrinomonadaceae bacterium]|nr:histidine kinase dimerization/phospho-acceptor domain-containing protein [Pyrinomonadaceae bacterium]